MNVNTYYIMYIIHKESSFNIWPRLYDDRKRELAGNDLHLSVGKFDP